MGLEGGGPGGGSRKAGVGADGASRRMRSMQESVLRANSSKTILF